MMKHFTFSAPGRILSGLLLFLFFSNVLSGQVANYTFSQSNVTYTLVASPTTLHATNWDDEVAAVTIPFTFIFNGVGYNAASVNSNGYLTFGGSASHTTAFNPISATRAYAGAISGFGRDLINNGAAIVQGIEGVTPNRVFVIQWNNARRYNGGAVSGDILNFQIRLYETSNKVEVRYGTNSASSTSDAIQGQVGLRGATNGDINNRSDLTNNNTAWAALSQGTSNDDNVNFKSTVVPASGLTFTWTPPVCNTITTFPFTETFESTSTTRPCWTNSFVSGNANWTYNTGAGSGSITSAHGGTHNARFVSQSGNGTPVTKLVSPVLNLTGVVNPVLDFWYGQQEKLLYGYNELKVYYRSSTSDVWNLIADLDQIKNVWTEVKNISLPNPSATYQLAFEGINYYGHANVLDDIVIKAGPPPILITPNITEICAGASVTLAASSASTPAYAYTWSPAAGLNTTTGSTVVAMPASTTVYTVTGTNGTFTTTKSVTVNVKPSPTAITMSETPVSTGGTSSCDLDYVKLIVVNNNSVTTVQEGFENEELIFTPDYSTTSPLNLSDFYWDSSVKTEGTRSLNFYGDQYDGPNYISLDLTNSIDLTKYTSATLTFDHICASEKDYDFGALYYSLNNGVNWFPLPPSAYSGTAILKQGFVSFDKSSYSNWNTGITGTSSLPTNALWKSETIDLSQFLGQPNFRISFTYEFDESYDYYGWNVDNIKINVIPKVAWSPATGLFTDSALTIPYLANANVTTVYAAPEVSTAYTASASIGTCSKTAATSPIIRTKKNFTGADAANPTHWSVPQNWSLNALPTLDKCVTIPSGKSVVVNIPTAEAKSIKVDQGAKLTILKDQVLTVKETFTNAAAEGDVIIESDGSLRQLNDMITVPNSGSVTARREITVKDNNQYNYLISPLIGSNLKTNVYEHQTTGVLSSSVYTLYHNEANNKFYSSTGAYIQGRSLAVKEPAASIVPAGGKINAHFMGVPMNGAFTYTLANSGTVATGYNLIGNPYPSNIDLDKFYNLKSNKDKISATFYFWDNTVNTETIQWGNEYDGAAYAIFNAVAGGEGTGVVAGSLALNSTTGTKEPTKVVKPGQGFMVRSISPTNKTIDFSNDIRIAEHGTVFFGKNGAQYAEDDRFYLKLTTPSGVVTQTATVYFEGGNTGFSQDDSEMNGTPSDVIYTFIGERKAVINGRAPFSDSDVIPIGSRHFAPGIYTIEIARKEGVFATGQNIYLRDNQTGTITNLSEGAYTFMAQAGESTGRFEIIYKPGGVLATDAGVKEDVLVYRDGQFFVVKAQRDPISSVEIFDAAGRMVRRVEPNITVERLDFSAIVNGTYILKINQKGKITVKKVIK